MTGRKLGLKFPTNYGSGIFVSSIRTTIIILPLVTSYYVLFVSYELCVKKENQIIFWNLLWHFFFNYDQIPTHVQSHVTLETMK